MRTWLCVAMLGTAACQAGPVETGRQAQAIEPQDYCTAGLPLESKWKPGEKLPTQTPAMVMISAELDRSKDRWGVYGADPVEGKISWLLHLSGAELRRFQLQAASATQPYGGVRGPIGGCIRNCGDDPPAAVLLNYANLDSQLQVMAEDASAACGK